MPEDKSIKNSFPVIILDKRILSEPAIVLLGYIALAIVISFTNLTLLQVGLAFILAVFGSGSSTVAVFFPRSQDLDFVERAGLSASLSLAIGGLSGFALARSSWGLSLWPFLVVTGLYNIVCYVLTWYRRRNLGEDENRIRLDSQKLFAWWTTEPDNSSRFTSAVLILVLLVGALVLTHNLRKHPVDPPMTEFYVLGQNGQTEEYPKFGRPGDSLNVRYGIVNRENETTSYQVKAIIKGNEVGSSQTVKIDSSEAQLSYLKFHLLDSLSGLTKVEFILYREGSPYRFLHLWIDIRK